MTSDIIPTPPLGTYPHDRLCGQIGNIPTSIDIRITSKIVLSDICFLPKKYEFYLAVLLFIGL